METLFVVENIEKGCEAFLKRVVREWFASGPPGVGGLLAGGCGEGIEQRPSGG